MNERVQKYLDLRRRLTALRVKTANVDCVEEVAILDEMDFACVVLTHDDIQQAEAEIEKLLAERGAWR